MKNPIPLLAVAFAAFTACPVHAELPMITEKPWLGYFLGLKDKKFQFGITSKGEMVYEPLKRSGEAVNIHNPVKVHFEVLETMPDGKVVSKQVKAETLESTSPAVIDPEKPVLITGKTTGDAAFEVAIIPDRGEMSVTGRITDKGSLKNPLTFAVTFDFAPYKSETMDDDEMKKFLKKIKRDEIRSELVDGGRAKLEFADEGNPATLHPKGFTALEIRTEAYGGVGFKFEASQKSNIILEDKGDRPLYKGFSIRWMINADADPTKEKLTIEAT